MDDHYSEDQFFFELLQETHSKFLESPVYLKQQRENKKWNYSVCGTPVQKNKGILFGINWGADSDHSVQSEMPQGTDVKKYHFMKRSKSFLENGWINNIETPDYNYTNFCFFRTPRACDLVYNDYLLSSGLFEKYVRFIKPPWLLAIGTTSFYKLENLGILSEIKSFTHGKARGYAAKLWDWNLFSVPHAGARLSNESRKAIWDQVTHEMRNRTDHSSPG